MRNLKFRIPTPSRGTTPTLKSGYLKTGIIVAGIVGFSALILTRKKDPAH